eukprot:CAMPEP_0171170820 /NCGR_PEP_ID=MMETSP0790-20130122/8904_1 /TAXON_ID=2925 /ORGANISM="Alexandrium catenella, Strain OF101" /LENGTH=353 /DNA_ID=CAMNT_0011635665 /DNA_START=66 /DNA_END=1127 /DNA_ORIENTATION=+
MAAVLAELLRPGAELSRAVAKCELAPTALVVLATAVGLAGHFADPLAARSSRLSALAVCWPVLALGQKPGRGRKASGDASGTSASAATAAPQAVQAASPADELVQSTLRALLQSLRSGGEERCTELARAMGTGRLNASDSRGRSVIHHAAMVGRGDLCAALLRSSGVCDAGAIDGDGSTALHLAAEGGHLDACAALLDVAPPGLFDARDLGGQNALHVAAWRGHAEVCGALAAHEHFGGTDARDKVGRTALHWAAFHGHAAACRAILAAPRFKKADVVTWKLPYREFGEGCTALHLSAHGGHAEACRAVLESPAFTASAAVECGGLTAAELAEEGDHTALAEWLAVAAGASRA